MRDVVFAATTAFAVMLLLAACDKHKSPPEGTYVSIKAHNCYGCYSFDMLVSETGAVTFTNYKDKRYVRNITKQVNPQTFVELREVIDEFDVFDLGEDPQRSCAREGPTLEVSDDLHSSNPRVSTTVTLFMSCARDREAAKAIARAFVKATGTAEHILEPWPRPDPQ